MARRFPAVISQAPGLRGTPSTGQCLSAATSASCANSSARPTSRRTRVRPAMILARSIRQTVFDGVVRVGSRHGYRLVHLEPAAQGQAAVSQAGRQLWVI